MTRAASLWDHNDHDAQSRLDQVVSMMRELSLQTDPEEMVRSYVRRLGEVTTIERTVSMSRRGLSYPQFRITRFSGWSEPINPWREQSRLPLLSGGLLAELIYGDVPRLIEDLRVAADDPAAPYLTGMKSLIAVPNYDQGVALNMTALMRSVPNGFDPEALPDRVWMSNLFGRATGHLVIKEELRKAYEVVDRELQTVANIQRMLLPAEIPEIPGLSLAASYETSRWAGGDYYDFFPLGDDRFCLLIADVSGHGTPAAVVMAILHAIAHGVSDSPRSPGAFLEHLHQRLHTRYLRDSGNFVTAFYGIYHAVDRTLEYANAGHNPPRLKRCRDGSIGSIDGEGGLPLGLFPDQQYATGLAQLEPGDQLVLYTDGITEAMNHAGEQFGVDRLDEALHTCRQDAQGLIEAVLSRLADFTQQAPAEDDQTLLVAKVT